MMNNFCITGRLTADPEIKETDNGSKVVNINLAVDRKYKDKDGNKITDFIPFSLWGKQAENLASISKQGALINLEGSVNTKDIEIDGHKSKSIILKVDSYTHLAAAKNYSDDIPENNIKEEKVMA